MSKAELLQHAARVLQVTQTSWASAMSTCSAGRVRSAKLIDTAATVLRTAPRMVSSRIWARMRRDRTEVARNSLLIR